MGKKLTVYMIDGTEYGPRFSEIGNWVGKAVYSPRATVNKIMSREEFDNPGIYCLKGDPTDEAFDERIYIGEAENIRARLKQHLSDPNKDFKEFSDLAIPEIQKNILDLENLITDSNQTFNLITLKLLIEKKIAISNEIIKVRELLGLNAAVEIVSSQKGKLIMDDIRHLTINMEDLAEKLLNERTEVRHDSFLIAQIFVVLGGILSVLIAIFLMIINAKSLKLKQNLQKSEGKFKQVLESAPDGILVIDGENKIQIVRYLI